MASNQKQVATKLSLQVQIQNWLWSQASTKNTTLTKRIHPIKGLILNMFINNL